MWDALGPNLRALEGQHQADADLMKVADNLKEMWRCWSVVNRPVSKLDRDADRLANINATRSLASALDYFYTHPYPPLRTTLNLYEHVTFSHLMPEVLKRKVLSLTACW
jgi:hypothetical protein